MTELPFSKSHIERLGGRLIASESPTSEDLAELQQLLVAYSDVLDGAVARVRTATEMSPTSRVKSTATILEKLRREGGSWLKSIQDLAGMRIVRAGTRVDQDELVAHLVDLFADEPRHPKVIDRRASPMHGYTAVHVIVFPDGVPVEIQVRTRWQHEWAELFEKLADLVGRGIRYGDPPDDWLSHQERAATDDLARELYDAYYERYTLLVGLAQAVAQFIDAVEATEAGTADVPGLEENKRQLRGALSRLRLKLDALDVTAEAQRVRGGRPAL